MSSLTINLLNELHGTLEDDDHDNPWAQPGVRQLDQSASAVADWYIEHQSERELIRKETRQWGSLWGLVLFVRRAGILVDADSRWVNRGLAIASIVDANCDYRDLIVSLVVLRSFAMDAGLETDAAFDVALCWSTEHMHSILLNARNHELSDIQSTVATFGPPTDAG
ncbi:hypothetical protein Poly51_62660 [Rubripirellula tenax]|uniref:Uncharacterized protein n=1 Tax=Rubripirellula tenax TaxID=2528015 RepID=A0A5C6E7H2_9BACT|nr:hypothetical protein Poly51_62660 [Rubripirellula tenax]